MNARPVPTLSRGELDQAVGAERRRLADAVDDLTHDQWATASLCAAWSVGDVVAHLTTTTRTGPLRVLRAAVRARGNFDRMEIDLAARQRAAHSPAELVVLLHESADSTHRMIGSSPMDPLMDLVIHAQDIARPLGLRYDSPPEVVVACLAYVASNTFMGGPRRSSGLRIVSADTGWSFGAGPEVRGPDVDLLLALSGRRAGLAALDGPGAGRLAARVT